MSDNPKPPWGREEIHGKTALEARQFARSNGELNAPVRGIRGLKDLARELDRRNGKLVVGSTDEAPFLPLPPQPERQQRRKPAVTPAPPMTP